MLFRVADLSRVWVELSVFERELAGIREGDEVELSPQTNAAVVLKGKVGRVGDVIDLETRSTDVRIVVDNTSELLRPGQSVTARIHRQVVKAEGFLLPREALTTVDGKVTVFVVREKNAVEPRTVVVGARDATRVQVTSGLAATDTVVTKGVFALKAEIFR
jgi:cobalt-zinc-cadmium efflux system membrane fusion protein